MECFIVEPQNVDRNGMQLRLTGDEARHCVRSLRMKTGEALFATDLAGTCYETELLEIQEPKRNEFETVCTILKFLSKHNESSRDVHLIQCILQQQSKFEEIVEKATEYGVRTIIPVTSERTEKSSINIERIERILRAATKQVSRANKPTIEELTSVEKALHISFDEGRKIFLFHETAGKEDRFSSEHTKAEKIAIVIGPEGGFTEDEVARFKSEFNAAVVSLGERRLRAEAAAIAALAIALC